MTFGSYTGITFDQACELSPHYFFWGIQIKKPGDQLENYLSYVREEYDIDFDNKALRKKGTDLVIPKMIETATLELPLSFGAVSFIDRPYCRGEQLQDGIIGSTRGHARIPSRMFPLLATCKGVGFPML